jgi:hypothetical protein
VTSDGHVALQAAITPIARVAFEHGFVSPELRISPVTGGLNRSETF